MAKIKVRAKFHRNLFGYYGGLIRRNGDVFYINDASEMGKWMTKVDEKVPLTEAPKPGLPLPEIYQPREGVEPASGKGSGEERGAL